MSPDSKNADGCVGMFGSSRAFLSSKFSCSVQGSVLFLNETKGTILLINGQKIGVTAFWVGSAVDGWEKLGFKFGLVAGLCVIYW